jgi:hypothetical protein
MVRRPISDRPPAALYFMPSRHSDGTLVPFRGLDPMAEKQPTPKGRVTRGPGRVIADRVRDRVLKADRALERQETARRPRVGRRADKRQAAAPDPAAAAPLSREVRALRAVFTDLGVAHRQYRKRTGESESPGLRAAALAFKAAPSLGSLVPVAEFLDDLDLLDW